MIRLVLIVGSLILTALPAVGGSEVIGRYVPGQDNTVVLQITVQRPAPAAFIVLQTMDSGLSLIAASPPPMGGNPGGSSVKWLFKRPRPGQLVVNMQFAQPVELNQLEGTIRYRHPQDGSLVFSRIGKERLHP